MTRSDAQIVGRSAASPLRCRGRSVTASRCAWSASRLSKRRSGSTPADGWRRVRALGHHHRVARVAHRTGLHPLKCSPHGVRLPRWVSASDLGAAGWKAPQRRGHATPLLAGPVACKGSGDSRSPVSPHGDSFCCLQRGSPFEAFTHFELLAAPSPSQGQPVPLVDKSLSNEV